MEISINGHNKIKVTVRKIGKNIVFAMTIKLSLEFWRNQEIPEKFWKTFILPKYISTFMYVLQGHRNIRTIFLCP